MNSLKAIWTVRAGLIPGVEEQDHRRTWTIHSQEWDGWSEEERLLKFHATADEASMYCRCLQNPRFANWATVEWLWL